MKNQIKRRDLLIWKAGYIDIVLNHGLFLTLIHGHLYIDRPKYWSLHEEKALKKSRELTGGNWCWYDR